MPCDRFVFGSGQSVIAHLCGLSTLTSSLNQFLSSRWRLIEVPIAPVSLAVGHSFKPNDVLLISLSINIGLNTSNNTHFQ